MEDETLLTVREAAAELGVSESAIRNATLQGRLNFIHKYGRKLISQADLIAYRERAHGDGPIGAGRPRVEKDSGASS